jgi:uncharacterized protein (DUF433 family)
MDLPVPLITIDPGRLGGAPCFTGTRVPVKTMFDHLAAGDPLQVFLDDFPTVSLEHAQAVLRHAMATATSGSTSAKHAAE